MIRLFMESFHAQSEATTWPQLRELGRVDRYRDVELTEVFETNRMYVRASSMSPILVKAAAPVLRKFLDGKNEPTIDVIVNSVETLKLPVDLDEVKSLWGQLTDRRLEFVLGPNGESIGMEYGSKISFWGKDVEAPPRGQRDRGKVSLLDFVDVYWNERELHALQPGRNEETRAIVRTIPDGLQDVFRDMTISATLYAIIILHYQLRMASPEAKKLCGADCQEERIRLQSQRSG